MRLPLLSSLLLSSLLISGCSTGPDARDCSGDNCDVHGIDDRFEVSTLETPELQRSGRAAGALFREEALVDQGGDFFQVADSRLYGEQLGLCPEVRFWDQPAGASCSGFLISSDVFVTAGHCLVSLPCESTHIVFDFAETGSGESNRIPKANVYECESVLFDFYGGGRHQTADIAILKLARPVMDRLPMKIAESSPVAGTEVLALGHPRGLPMKASPGTVQEGAFTEFYDTARDLLKRFLALSPLRPYLANIGKESENEAHIYAALDVYGGNSGGALVDATTGEVSGVLVREGFKAIVGAEGVQEIAAQSFDFLRDEAGGCYRQSVCGESVECLNYPSAVPLADYATQLQAAVDGVPLLDTDLDSLNDKAEELQGLDPQKADSDGDFIADAEEVGRLAAPQDSDEDGIIDALDEDSDADGISDQEEAGDSDLTTPALDTDQDGLPNYLDLDSDGDTIADDVDNCRLALNFNQGDLDGDGQGDACDGDVDGDEVPDEADLCRVVADPEQRDSDLDGVGDACDGDIDGDGVNNGDDSCVKVANSSQEDSDGDGVGDACDEDDADDEADDDECTDEEGCADSDDAGDECTEEGGSCDEGEAASGCSVGAGSTGAWWPLLLAIFLRRRRRGQPEE